MASFSYKAKDRSGQLITGTLDADNRSAVTTRLQSMGYFPLEIQGGESDRKGVLAGLSRKRAPRVKGTDLAGFYREISDLIGAGVPLVRALTVSRQQTENETLRGIVSQVSADVQEGDTFAEALGKHPKTFNKLNIALVRAGETGALLDQTLSRIADYAETQEELKGKVKAALAYPVIMSIVGVIAVVVLLTYVMPKVLSIFAELNQNLPGMTVLLLKISTFLNDYWLFIAIGLVVGVGAFRRTIATPGGALRFHQFLLRIPIFGELILKREIANFTRTLGSLLGNGVPILNALSIAAEVTMIVPIRQEIEKIPGSITQGSGMAPTLRASKLFPPVLVNMVAVGEETGNLPDVLLRVAHSYEVQVERNLKTLTSFLEPMIILVMGLVVGFIVIAMLLPIFSIDPTAGM